jgi:hypothetical protein
VFGNADRLGDTAREYTLAGYIDSDVELNAWYDLQSTWQRLSTEFDSISRMWWSHKCKKYLGLKVLPPTTTLYTYQTCLYQQLKPLC